MNSGRKKAWQGSGVRVLKNSNIISNQEGNYHRLNLVGRSIIFVLGIVFLLWALCGGSFCGSWGCFQLGTSDQYLGSFRNKLSSGNTTTSYFLPAQSFQTLEAGAGRGLPASQVCQGGTQTLDLSNAGSASLIPRFPHLCFYWPWVWGNLAGEMKSYESQWRIGKSETEAGMVWVRKAAELRL